MKALALVEVILPLLRGLLSVATKSNLPGEIIDSVDAAIVALEKVQNTPVIKSQLEDARVEVPW